MTRLPLFLLVPLALAGCASPAPAPMVLDTTQMHYDYLTRLRLNVASIEISDQAPIGATGDVAPLAPEPPSAALRQMAQDRLAAAGNTGRAVFVIENASIIRGPDNSLTGSLAVRLDIYAGSGTPTAYAEARVSRITSQDDTPLRVTLDAMTRKMLDDMNVEFEYQIRHSLNEWLQPTTPTSTPAAVQSAPLPPP